MSKWLSSALMPSVLAATAGLFMLTATLTAQPPATPQPSDPKNVGDLRTTEQRNDDLFRKFQRELLSLAQKLERSETPEDKERAKVIYAALDLAKKEGVEGQFQKLIGAMAKGNASPVELDTILGQDKQLNKALREILAVLMTDDETARIKAEIARLEEFLKAAREIKRQQDILRALTDAKKGDPNRLSKSQGELADRTKDLGNKMDGNKKDGKDSKGNDGKGGEKGVAKAENKAEAKPGDTAGEGKSDTDQNKGESKDGMGGGDPMKDGMGGAESKGSGDGKPEDGAAKPASEGKDGDEAGKGRDSGMPKDGLSGGKVGQPGGKEGQPGGKEGQPGGKEGQPGGKEGIAGKEGQGGKSKGGGQQGDSKAQGQGKGDDKGNQGQQGGDPKNKNDDQKQNDQQGGSKGGGQQGEPSEGGGGGGQPPPPQPQQNQPPGRKQLQEAYPHQKNAEDELKKNERDNAGKQEDKAIEKLAQAIQELEKRLKQLREEEMLKTLAALEARCNRMLQMQIEVYEATKAIDGIVLKNNNQKTTAEVQKAQQQADKETEIIREAGLALKLLESEGSAVAFARVLEEVREDMVAVQRRLADSRVDKDTQTIEENIISILKDMILALKKAQQEIQQQQGQPPPPAGQQKPGQKPLIDLLNELKLLKALQLQVNGRTKMYGDKTPGEQSSDPILQAELKQLAARQAKLQEMLNDIATGKNK